MDWSIDGIYCLIDGGVVFRGVLKLCLVVTFFHVLYKFILPFSGKPYLLGGISLLLGFFLSGFVVKNVTVEARKAQVFNRLFDKTGGKVLGLLEELVNEGNGDLDLVRELGLLYNQLGRCRDTITLFENRGKEHLQDPYVRLVLARAYLANHNPEKAIAEGNVALKQEPAGYLYAWVCRTIAEAYIQLGEREKAAESLSLILEKIPNDEEARRLLLQKIELLKRTGMWRD